MKEWTTVSEQLIRYVRNGGGSLCVWLGVDET